MPWIAEGVLRELMLKAYDAGWRGSLELREGVVEDLLKSLPPEPPKDGLVSHPTNATSSNQFTVYVNGTYYGDG